MTDVPVEAPSVIQSWMIALPSILGAISIWYTRRTTKASDKKTENGFTEAQKTQAVQAELISALRSTVSTQNALINSQVNQIKALTAKVEETRQCQVSIADKHQETMNKTSAAVDKLASILDPKAPHIELSDFGDVTQVDTPTQPHGKVIVKP